jgi:hypothetical protein
MIRKTIPVMGLIAALLLVFAYVTFVNVTADRRSQNLERRSD